MQVFATFKSSKAFTAILEHASPKEGRWGHSISTVACGAGGWDEMDEAVLGTRSVVG